ncbi:hypothetical protein C8R43DRAFT_989101 [Mycena crocata]|nr:hypothetical protein C8R43DRAFT_989101 [Mycena crocata]
MSTASHIVNGAVSSPPVILRRTLKGDLPSRAAEGTASSLRGTIDFQEIRSRGPPPATIMGRPGDIYWDLTPPFLIYVREATCWSPSDLLVKHPNFEERYLWISNTMTYKGLGWFTAQHLRNQNIDLVPRPLDGYSRKILGGFFDEVANPRSNGSPARASKRERESESDSESMDLPMKLLRLEPPTLLSEIPTTIDAIVASYHELGRRLRTVQPAVHDVVSERLQRTAHVVNEMQQLRTQNHELIQDAAVKVRDVAMKDKLIEDLKQTLQNQQEQNRQTFIAATTKLQRLKNDAAANREKHELIVQTVQETSESLRRTLDERNTEHETLKLSLQTSEREAEITRNDLNARIIAMQRNSEQLAAQVAVETQQLKKELAKAKEQAKTSEKALIGLQSNTVVAFNGLAAALATSGLQLQQ